MRRAFLLSAVLVLVATACSSGGGGKQASVTTAPPVTMSTAPPAPSTAAPTTTAAFPAYKVAWAEVARVGVYGEPGAAAPVRTFAHPNPTYGSPRAFLVKEEQGDWLNVYLPARPNGSTGWIKKSDVTLQNHNYRIVVELGAHKLTLYEKDDVVYEAPVGVGASATPSTSGLFYTTELIEVIPSQRAAYGPFAYGLSAYSEVLYSFGEGDGQMGIHGTGDPSSVGRSVSNGCIRMTNDAITHLRETLPGAGVPVEIKA